MAERLPQLLDDAVKKSRHISLDQLCNNMDPDRIYKMLPMSFPVSPENEVYATVGSWDQPSVTKKICGVVRYPVQRWKACGAPYLSGTSWCKLMMVLGSQNPEMAEIVEIAEAFEGRAHEAHQYNLKNLRKMQAERVAKGWKSTIKVDIENGDRQCWSNIVQKGNAASSQDNW